MTTPANFTLYTVAEANLPELALRIARINKQAAKLGCPPVTAEATGKFEDIKVRKETALGLYAPEITERWVEIKVTGEQPKLEGGWILLGVIDFTEALPLVAEVPGQQVPTEARARGPVCDHCNQNRARSATYVLRAEDGRTVNVGRTCLADFLGKAANDPARALMFYAGIAGALDFEESDRAESFRCPAARVNVADIVKLSGAVINLHGFLSGAKARIDFLASTSDRVAAYVNPPAYLPGSSEYAEHVSWMARVDAERTQALRTEAADAIAWAAKMADRAEPSEFAVNVATLAKLETAGVKYLGTLVWIMAGFRKDQERLAEASRKAEVFANSQHVGEIKARMEADLTLLDIRVIESDFGTSYLTTFADAAGNKIKWFAGRDIESDGWPLDETRHCKMTPKKHGDWKGTLETQVTRVAEFTPKAPKARKPRKAAPKASA